ncbi:hypothetical protein A1O1_03709 [Capronia coronata CBS 617.96]|uniref:Xylanolytic transcriptional activator regulatory domain-containing protein n=1 Tax=Capronia coronata CBS 617.96 TaxID=1182541 RepID=W9YMY9_9EURO|nr:uncharacterized protein A1O1_03709 [Capronia coronata CBS 617.96]EXJ90606.1 hypothetical protein A1O1_03709 [Capronia coronata CBS 617.96]
MTQNILVQKGMDVPQAQIQARKTSHPQPRQTEAQTQGKLVFDRDRSRYLQEGFWAAMYDEIGDLKYTLESEPRLSKDFFLFPNIDHDRTLSRAHPPILEGDFLIQTYIDKVDPFVRILHKPTLLRDLNHFRRGILPDAHEFECGLFAVYALALLPLCSTVVEYRLHEPKAALLSKYRSYVEHGLSRLNLTTTQSLSTLRTFVLYITLLFWTGEMLHVSTLLAVAFTIARRMGFNRDGTHFPISHWQTELRRRLWHHLVLLDAWCVENHGLQPTIHSGESDVCLPLNCNDSSWDTSEFASSRPDVQAGAFTEMTPALVQYELSALATFVLAHPYTPATSVRDYLDLQSEVVRQARQRLEIAYLRTLDEGNILQRLTRDLHDHAFRRIALMQLAPIMSAKGLDERERVGLEAKLYQLAIDYCKMSNHLTEFYTPHSLDWVIVRAFSWHSVATLLSMVLRHEALSNSLEARAARYRIERLFRNRPSVDFLAVNDNLWQPLQKLRDELAARESSVLTPGRYELFGSEDAADAVSVTSTTIDPSLFGPVDEGLPHIEGWGDGAVTDSFVLDAFAEKF